MQLVIEQEVMVQALGHTLGIIEKRGSMPILSHCLIEAVDPGLVISATDLEMSFRGAFSAKVVEPGVFTVNAQVIHSLVKSLPKGALEIAGDEDRIKLTTGGSCYKLLTLPAEQFPFLPKVMEDDLVEVEAWVLVDLIRKTIFSTGDDLQYNLRGILLKIADHAGHKEEALLQLVSSDGHRLSLAGSSLPGFEELKAIDGIMVSLNGMREVKRFAERAKDGKVKLGFLWPQEKEGPPRSLCLKAGDQELVVRFMDLKFPEYRRIIPESWKNRFDLPRQATVEALRRVSSLSTERFRGVVLTLRDKEMEITFDSPDVGHGREVVEILEKSGDFFKKPITIGFNARYFLEPLAVMKGERVALEFVEPGRPVRLMDPTDPLAFWLVMPMDI